MANERDPDALYAAKVAEAVANGKAVGWPARAHTVNKLHKCACRDCTVECLGWLCSRCASCSCDGNGANDCRCPNAYALSAKKNPRGY